MMGSTLVVPVMVVILVLLLLVDGRTANSKRLLQQVSSGSWESQAGMRNILPNVRPDLLRSYGIVSARGGKIVESAEVWWHPQDPALVRPVLDAKGTCYSLHHLSRRKPSHTGGIVLIGDEASARASMTLASSLNARNTAPTCSQFNSCQHHICGRNDSIQLHYISSKAFMRGSCLGTASSKRTDACSSEGLVRTMANADVIVFGMGHHLASTYNSEGAARTEVELERIARWMHDVYAPTVNTTTLVVFQSLLPYDKYCDPRNRTDESLHQTYLRLAETVDRRLYRHLQDGALGKHPLISFTEVDVAGAMFAREELHRSNFLEFTEANRNNCELRSVPSDTIMLLLSHIYGALLAHVTPTAFPAIVAYEVEDYDRAVQRVALHELNVVNYLLAQMHLADAMAHRHWHLPRETAVTLSITDIRYAEAIPYWYYSRRLYQVEGVIVAMDSDTCAHLRTNFPAYLALCMHIPHSMSVAPPHKLNTIVAAAKVIYPLLFMVEYNMSVIFSEMDIFWRGNPYPFLTHPDRSQYDIQVSAHVYFNWRKVVTTVPKELNIGFFFLRPTPGAIQLFTDMLQFLTQWPFATVDIATMDQKLFDLFIRNHPAPQGEEQPCCLDRIVGWERARPQSHFEGFKWLRLPGDVFTHNDAQELAIVPQTLAYHISWGIDPPSRRIHCAYTLGLLPTNYTHITTYDNQKCFAYLYV